MLNIYLKRDTADVLLHQMSRRASEHKETASKVKHTYFGSGTKRCPLRSAVRLY